MRMRQSSRSVPLTSLILAALSSASAGPLSALKPVRNAETVAQAKPPPSPMPDWLHGDLDPATSDDIDNANARFSAAWMDGDVAAIVSSYTEDATLHPPAGGVLKSRNLIRGVWEPIARMNRVAHRVEPALRERLSPVLVLEMGRWHSTTRKEEVAVEATGCYTVIWRKDTGNTWRMHYDAWGAPNPASWACRPR